MSAPTTSLTGSPQLLRATLHHDGRHFAPWLLIVTALSSSSALIYPWVFPTLEDRETLAAAVGANPALGLIFGPAYDLSTVDGFNTWRSLALGGFLIALGAIFTVVRATRAQEDTGQAELLASGVMGRSARLMAGIGIALIGSVAAGLAAALVTVLCGGGWGPSLLLGATFAATGWMFTGVAAATANIGSDARTASSLAIGTLGVLFLLRGFSASLDAPAWTVWINPLGWMLETRPASGDHWEPLALAVVFAAVMIAVAFMLQSRRDFGQGAVAQQPGPARGATRTTWSLVMRLNRSPMITWLVAFAALGVVFGYFTASLDDLLGGEAAVQQILAAGAVTPQDVTAAFVRTVVSLVGILAAVPGVQVMLKLRVEEMEDRVEPIMAGAVRRGRYFASNVVLALSSTAVYMTLAGAIIATIASNADIGVTFSDVFTQALVTIPAVWTVIAFAVAVVGARPAAGLAAWAGVLLSFALTLLGPTFGFDDWVLAISPFWHVPQVLSASPVWGGLAGIGVIACLLVAGGFGGFRKRDLAR